MAVGLGSTAEEIADLRSKIDDSFWVMRIIGGTPPCFARSPPIDAMPKGYPPLPNEYDGFSCGAHRLVVTSLQQHLLI